MRSSRLLLAASLICLCCTGCWLTGDPRPGPPSPPPPGSYLNVGIKTYQPGLDEWTPGANSPTGFEWSMLSTIFGGLGYRIRPNPITSDDWEQELDDNTVSVAAGSISYTPKRASGYLLAGPYMSGRLAVLSLKQAHVPIDPGSELRKQAVCYVASSPGADSTTAQVEVENDREAGVPFTQVPVKSTQDCLAELQTRHASVFLSDAIILRGIEANLPQFTVDDLSGQFGEAQDYYIAFQKKPGMSALCQKIDQALSSYLGSDQASGWWDNFSANFNDGVGQQLLLEDYYKPDRADINSAMCSLANSG